MKKIVPFKKDLLFKTDVLEIASISLEHTLSIKDTYLISGNFLVNGDYRITENSTSLEKFFYEIPFEIHMDEKYDLKNATIDIDDFYYEIINNKVLAVSIDVCLDKLEEKKIEEKEEMKEEMVDNRNAIKEETEEVIEEEKEEVKEVLEEVKPKERCIEEEDTAFTAMSAESTETYKSYKVYIVREGDTVESILTKYGVSKSDLEDYNDLSNMNINDKILIPFINETAS